MADLKILLQAIAKPWFMEPIAAAKYASVVDNLFKDGNAKNIWSNDLLVDASAPLVFFADAKGKVLAANDVASPSPGKVAILNVAGAIMKYDYCGAPGTQSMMNMIDQLNADDSITAIILQIDSPGGAVDGTQQLAEKISGSKKPVIAYINGMMASAAMWIGSAASYRVASSKTDMIGSIGTLVSWRDNAQANAAAGVIVHEVYATKSTDKNKEFREASAGNYDPLLNNILNPINEEFIKGVQKNLPNVDQSVFSGAIYLATEAKKVGLINEIGSLKTAINAALKMANSNPNKKTKMENQKFDNVQKIVGAETLEQVNEGIWLTAEQLVNIDAALQTSADAITTAENNVLTMQSSIDDAADLLKAMQSNNDTLTARVLELEQMPILGAAAAGSNDPGDEQDADAKYLTSVDIEAKERKKKYGF